MDYFRHKKFGGRGFVSVGICHVLFFQGFDQPHDLAVSPDGEAVFVGETSPDVVWKFIKAKEQ